MIIDGGLIEKGDRIEVWIDRPRTAVVQDIIEAKQGRTLRVQYLDRLHDIQVPAGHSVDLVC